MRCPRCSRSYPPGFEWCEPCHERLPEEVDPPPVDDRLRDVRGAVERFEQGESSEEEFLAFLDEMAAELAQKEQGLLELDLSEDLQEFMREELEAGLEGIGGFQEGLEVLRSFEPEDLAHGLAMVEAANERLNEALRLNRENRRRLEADYSEASLEL